MPLVSFLKVKNSHNKQNKLSSPFFLLSLQNVFLSNFVLYNPRPQDRTLECSTCKLLVPVPAKGIEAFPLNFFINNMLTVLAVQNPTKCTNCEDSSQATARCLDCVENLCTNCVFAHKRIRQTKDHRILSFDEIQANEVKDIIRCPSFCSVHPREVSFFSFGSFWGLQVEALKFDGIGINNPLGGTRENIENRLGRICIMQTTDSPYYKKWSRPH